VRLGYRLRLRVRDRCQKTLNYIPDCLCSYLRLRLSRRLLTIEVRELQQTVIDGTFENEDKSLIPQTIRYSEEMMRPCSRVLDELNRG
jgi:hypothetical protein